MNDLKFTYQELINELLKNYPFFIPFNFIEQDYIIEIINYLDIKLNDNFYENYVDVLLYFDENLEVQTLETYEIITSYNTTKLIKLEENCFKLVSMQDSFGISSFNYIFEKYYEKVVVFDMLCDILIDFFQKFYAEMPNKPIFLFTQQKQIIHTHLIEIESKLSIENKKMSFSAVFENLKATYEAKSFIQINNDNSLDKKSLELSNEIETIKPFQKFIMHNKNIEIEKIVKQHFSDFKGVKLRYLVEYFIEKKVLILNSGDKTILYKSFKLLFNNKNIGHRNSIFGDKVFNNQDINYIKTKLVFDKLFDDVLK
jgi:hypothetical protein